MRLTSLELRYLGEEPKITKDSTDSEVIRAYNYFQYLYTADDAKSFVVSFLKSRKVKDPTGKLKNIPPLSLMNIGWNCKLMLDGNTLPEDIRTKSMAKLDALIKGVKEKKEKKVATKGPTISVQDHIAAKAGAFIADLEDQVDIFYNKGKNDFDVNFWFQKNDIKPQVSKLIAKYYQPLYEEVYEAINGDDKELKEAYSHWKKASLKKFLDFIKSFISTSEVASVPTKRITKRQKKKKVKPTTVLVSKMKYQKEDTDLGLTSVRPADIVGCQQLWTFNTKTRKLAVYNAMGPAGLTVKGTSVYGFDDKSSITKTTRKPEETIERVLDGGKIVLRNLMGELKTTEKPANGRINTTTILLRTTR